MTALPTSTGTKLGLVIDLDICVGCHACAVNCKEWNTGGHSAPLTDQDPYGAAPDGVWFNRVHSYEAGEGAEGLNRPLPQILPALRGCRLRHRLPTGASYKREEDGIVLVNAETCIGCKLCSWACPYGAREYDVDEGVMKKCTMCVDRIYNENLEEEERVPACVSTCPAGARHYGDLGDPNSAVSQLVVERLGYDLMPELGYKPTNKYLPPREAASPPCCSAGRQEQAKRRTEMAGPGVVGLSLNCRPPGHSPTGLARMKAVFNQNSLRPESVEEACVCKPPPANGPASPKKPRDTAADRR